MPTRDDNDPLVIAPGGPLPASRIIHVLPGQVVEHDDSGGHVITPGDHSSTGLTPSGPRARSRVHRVEAGVQLHNTGQQIQLINRNGDVLSRVDLDADAPPASDAPPGRLGRAAMGSGWITGARWQNTTRDPISDFATTFTVPDAPSTQSGQTVFLSVGLTLDDTTGYHLTQALQWGPSLAGGGRYWTVGAWYEDAGMSFHSELVRVDAGDVLTAQVAFDKRSGDKIMYTISVTNAADTLAQSMKIQTYPELKWTQVNLTAWNVTKCSDYPATDSTRMSNNIIRLLSGKTPPLTWTVNDRVTDCGQRSVVVADKKRDIDVFYR